MLEPIFTVANQDKPDDYALLSQTIATVIPIGFLVDGMTIESALASTISPELSFRMNNAALRLYQLM
jgi:hypothetical protein